jgi:RNA polymerase sigma factor (sigma-70 family)
LVGTPQTPQAVKKPKNEKTAYQKTEQLLFAYNGFKRIVAERQQEIDDIRKYGVPEKASTVGERVQTSRTVQGIVLPEESVENAVRSVQESLWRVQSIVDLIDQSMATLKSDPYYKTLELRYFKGWTQEDIALELHTTQKTISVNKTRLVKELSMHLFPEQAIDEMMR